MSSAHTCLDSSLLRMPTAEVPEPGSGGQGMYVKQGEKGKDSGAPFPQVGMQNGDKQLGKLEGALHRNETVLGASPH